MQTDDATADRFAAGGVWRQSRADAWLVGASLAHAGVLIAAALLNGSARSVVLFTVLLAIALWWNANTVSHNFIHLPFFRSKAGNAAYSIFLSLLLGVPQTLYRDRHLAHHARRAFVFRGCPQIFVEALAVLTLWFACITVVPHFFWTIYLPAYCIGLLLGLMQSHFEHSPVIRSHYGAIYNRAFFNDGYHVEHHEHPGCHWARLPEHGSRRESSPFPPVLRWLELASLTGLERLVLYSRRLQGFVLQRHERALRHLLPEIGRARQVTIVGGGLFPRTAVILRSVWPDIPIRIVDLNPRNLETARRYLAKAGLEANIEFTCERFEPGRSTATEDLLVTPLTLEGDRELLYAEPPARRVLVHDWIWRRGSGASARVSWLLLKRMNLLSGECRA